MDPLAIIKSYRCLPVHTPTHIHTLTHIHIYTHTTPPPHLLSLSSTQLVIPSLIWSFREQTKFLDWSPSPTLQNLSLSYPSPDVKSFFGCYVIPPGRLSELGFKLLMTLLGQLSTTLSREYSNTLDSDPTILTSPPHFTSLLFFSLLGGKNVWYR